MRKLLLILIILPIYLNAQDEFFHKQLSYSTLSINDPQCQTCHTNSLNTTTTQTQSNQNQLIPVTHETANSSAFGADPMSVACLHCHDGICAQNAPVKLPGCISNPANKSEHYDLIKSHPIFITYPNKKELKSQHEPLPASWKNAQNVQDLLRKEKVVCISCHLPHHTKEKGFLRTTMSGSFLCFGCHNK